MDRIHKPRRLAGELPRRGRGLMDLIATSGRLRCRLNLFHRWATFHTADGESYQRCTKCGKDQGIRRMPYLGETGWMG